MDHHLFDRELQTRLLDGDPTGAEGDEELHDEQDSLAATLETDAQMADPHSELREVVHTVIIQDPTNKRARTDVELAEAAVLKASEQVVVQSTLNEYNRLWKTFTAFSIEVGYVSDLQTLNDELIHGPYAPTNYPTRIAAWIMSKCDDVDIKTITAKPLEETRLSYAHAQKMRAAISHKFGREFQCGTQVWSENPQAVGQCTGNPSLSSVVSQYMISLRRRKVRGGEIVTSARAINEDIIKKLYDYNINFDDSKLNARKRKAGVGDDEWGGREVRLQLQTLYVLSFLCLLRFDEALRIEWSWIQLDKIQNPSGKWVHRITLMLPFRKTHQTGGIAPFYLLPNYKKPWLCPVTTLATWIQHITVHKQGNLNGFVFRRKFSAKKTSDNPREAMSTDSFLKCFRNNLTDVKVDPRPFGTHSFRRGGCQYLHFELRWGIIDICSWGGWADDFDNQGTIFKYLLSWTDGARIPRPDFFNTERRTKLCCGECGRSCPCC